MNIKHWIAVMVTAITLAACGGGYDAQSSSGNASTTDTGSLVR